MNVLSATTVSLEKVSLFFQALSPNARLEILLAIGTGESCVCHLEAILGYRQAYISQHLMALRNANLIESRREGRYIYHRLKDPALLDFIQQAAKFNEVELSESSTGSTDCCCPNCVP